MQITHWNAPSLTAFFSSASCGFGSGTSSLSTRSMTLYSPSSSPSDKSSNTIACSSTGSFLELVRRKSAACFACDAAAAAAAPRNEDTAIGLSEEEEAVDVRAVRRLLLLVGAAGLSEGLEAVRSFVARRLRVCLDAGMAVAGFGEEEEEKEDDDDAREVAEAAGKL